MDNDAPIISVPTDTPSVKRRHRAPTTKQIRALQLINQGYSKRRAMIEAGYSKSTANTKNVVKSSAAIQILDSMKNSLQDPRLSGQFMANKMVQWLDAKKSDPDDYKTQIAAFREYKNIMEPEKDESRIKKRVTFEEFIEDETKLP
jgi:hypothetical protein